MVDIARCQHTFHLHHGFLRFLHQWLIQLHPPSLLPPDNDILPPLPPPDDLEDVAKEVPPLQPSEESNDSKEQTPPPQSDEDETNNALIPLPPPPSDDPGMINDQIPPPPPSLQESDSHHSVTSPDWNDTHMSMMDMDTSLELPPQPPSNNAQFLAEDINNPQLPNVEDQPDVLFHAEWH
ncbi:hypothetical protein BKA82DRAFT_4019503 [Pisolithus tinctorius]|nr:hypothetical protein BKA82DRAFT_4019503 [Pisolithus tinctorius]